MTQNHPPNENTPTRMCWMTDLHLDQADSKSTTALLHKLAGSEYDIALITGDIASSRHLPEHLAMLAKACGQRPLYVALGNHDHYGSGVAETRDQIGRLCKKIPNLHHLESRGPVELGNHTILIGGDGWADGQWRGRKEKDIDSPDHYSIRDFRGLCKWARYRKMRDLGRAATASIRQRLKPTLRQCRKIIVANHVPAFRTSALFNGKPCDADHQPHFVHASLGAMLIGMAREYPDKQFRVVSGHTHSECTDHVLPNLTSMVGGHRKHNPQIQDILAA